VAPERTRRFGISDFRVKLTDLQRRLPPKGEGHHPGKLSVRKERCGRKVLAGAAARLESDIGPRPLTPEGEPVNLPLDAQDHKLRRGALQPSRGLGGLISDQKSANQSGVPGTYSVPILGFLFGETNKQATRTELIVVLTPRVIASDLDVEAVTKDLGAKLKGLEYRFRLGSDKRSRPYLMAAGP
jgi:hypothetical protein